MEWAGPQWIVYSTNWVHEPSRVDELKVVRVVDDASPKTLYTRDRQKRRRTILWKVPPRAPIVADAGTYAGSHGVCTVRIGPDGPQPSRLLAQGSFRRIEWSPDGRHLLLHRKAQHGESLWLVEDAADVPKVPVQVARAPAGFRVNAQFSPASNWIVYLVDRPPSLVSAAGATLLGSHRVLVVRSALVRQLISASGRTNLRSNLSPTPHSAFVWQIASRTRHLLFAPSGKRQLHEADWAPDDRAVVLAIADTLNTTLLLRFARGNRLERPEVLHTARLGERVRSLWQP